MQYRKMPNDKNELSVLGFGCMRLPLKNKHLPSSIDTKQAKELIRYAIDNGVNYIDTAWPYHMGKSESFLGEHVLTDGYREKVNLATKLPCFLVNSREKMDTILDKQLSNLKTDHIDYYLLHALNGAFWDKMKKMDIISFMDKIKKEGKVKKMGFSFHGEYEDFVRIIDDYDFDFVQVQYNLLDENFQAGIKGINYAASKGLGVIIMEPLRGGTLVAKIPKEIKKIYSKSTIKRTPASWALKWIYDNPDVTVVLSGMNDLNHLKENINTATESLPNGMNQQEKEILEEVKNKYNDLLKVRCTGCGYCMPCPAGINIPEAFKNLNNYYMFSKYQAKRQHMIHAAIMTKDGKSHYASDCRNCGLCETKCPQGINIREELKDVRDKLETPVFKLGAKVIRPIGRRGMKKDLKNKGKSDII